MARQQRDVIQKQRKKKQQRKKRQSHSLNISQRKREKLKTADTQQEELLSQEDEVKV